MKTTIEFSDPFMKKVRDFARSRGMTLRGLIESCLRKEMVEESSSKKPFKLRKKSFRGQGLCADLDGATWDDIRARIYATRGEP